MKHPAAWLLIWLPTGLLIAAPALQAQREQRAIAKRLDYDMKKVAIPAALNETELKGRILFTQRCAACHYAGQAGAGGGSEASFGPWIDQKRVAALGEQRVRTTIETGSRRMPGFRYMFQPAQLDQIVAFLKTVTPDHRERVPQRE